MTKKCLPILMLTLLTGCNEPKHVSGVEFKREWELRDAQTMVCSEYLGEKDGKVFLKRKTMSLVSKDRWNEEVWFTETNNLDSAFLERLKKEKVPGLALDDATPQRRLEKAIHNGDYETADRLLEEWLAEAGGGLFVDAALLKRALVNAKAGRYAESIAFIDQLLRDYPDSVYRESALALRRWVEGQQGKRQ